MDHSSVEIFEYRGTNNSVLASETNPASNYNPKNDYWYENIEAWPRAYWNDVQEDIWGDKELMFSVPIFDKQKNIIGIIGIGLSLQHLSNFISHLQIGITGSVFVLNENGNIILPLPQDVLADKKNFSEDVAKIAYTKFKKENKQELIFNHDKIKYITYVTDFPLSYEKDLLIDIIVPFNDFFGNIIKSEINIIFISFSILIISGILIYFASKSISAPIVRLTNKVDRIKHFDFSEHESITSHIIEVITLNDSIKAMSAALQSFGKYVPKEIVKTLIAQGKEISLGGEKISVVIMFSDIENFTTFSESTPLEEVTRRLSDYFDKYSKIILQNEGTIDKYIGDGIMAFWGAPKSVIEPEMKACLSCLRCIKAASSLLASDEKTRWHTRFGIHSGEVIVGNIGTSERMNYTIIGDAVNTASRLEGINKEYNTSLIISSSVKEKLDARFVTRPIDHVRVKGKKVKLIIYELIGLTEGEETDLIVSQKQRDFCKAFDHAFQLFQEENKEEAKKAFLAIREQFPHDHVTEIYLSRLGT